MEGSDSTNSAGTLLLIFIGGVGAGIALASIFAPQSGAATRGVIGRKVGQGPGWVKAKAETAREYLQRHADELREKAKVVAEVIARG